MAGHLVFIRHAHRDTNEGLSDNGLSEKGRRQAQDISEFLASYLKKGVSLELFSSPKLRCRETLEPFSSRVDLNVIVDQNLDEHRGNEDSREFHERVIRTIEGYVSRRNEVAIICSHGDWLPIAIHHLTGTEVALKKGGLADLRMESERAHIQWLIQSFKHF